MEVNVHEAKTHLSRLLKQVAAGEEITISRAGVPVARMIAAHTRSSSRPMGMDKGKIWMAHDFDRLDPGLEALFFAPITSAAPTQKTGPRTKKKKTT